jgi:hypothetical protein
MPEFVLFERYRSVSTAVLPLSACSEDNVANRCTGFIFFQISVLHLQVHVLDFSPASTVVERKNWNEAVRRLRIWFIESVLCQCMISVGIVPFHSHCYSPPMSDRLSGAGIEAVKKGSELLEALLEPAATGVWYGYGHYVQYLATTCASDTPMFDAKACYHLHCFLILLLYIFTQSCQGAPPR